MVYSYSYLSVIFKVSWSIDVAQNFQNSLNRSIHILASLIYSPGICFYDKYKDSFTHVRVLLYIWYGETVHKRKNVNRGPRSNFLAECVPRPIKFGQPWSRGYLIFAYWTQGDFWRKDFGKKGRHICHQIQYSIYWPYKRVQTHLLA